MTFEPGRSCDCDKYGTTFHGGSESYAGRFLRQLVCGIEPDRQIDSPKDMEAIWEWLDPGDFGLDDACRVMAYCFRRFGVLDDADPGKFFGGMILTSPNLDVRVGLLFRGTSVGVQPLIIETRSDLRSTDPEVAEAVFAVLTSLLEPVYVRDQCFNIKGLVKEDCHVE